MTPELQAFIQKSLCCPKTACPFYNEQPGYYPRFAYGNTNSKVMAVFQNPGSPKRIQDLAQRTVKNAQYAEMVTEAHSGIKTWLFKENKKHEESDFSIPGSSGFLDSFYITQSYRCSDPESKEAAGKWKQAQSECLDYLFEEITIVKPKVIFCFGSRAIISVSKVLDKIYGTGLETKEMKIAIKGLKSAFKSSFKFQIPDGPLVIPIVHPDGVWKKPTMSKTEYSEIIKTHLQALQSNNSVDLII